MSQVSYATRNYPRNLHTVLPSGSTPLEHAIVYAYDGQPVPTVIENLNDADKTDARLLNALAYQRNVEYWSMGASEQTKRAIIKESVQLHRIKGTVYSVRRALDLMGVSTKITEWWQMSPKGEPGTFSIDLMVGGGFESQEVLSKTRIEQVIHAVQYWKPVSRGFSFRVGLWYGNQLRATNAHQTLHVMRRTVDAKQANRTYLSTLAVAGAMSRPLHISRFSMELT